MKSLKQEIMNAVAKEVYNPEREAIEAMNNLLAAQVDFMKNEALDLIRSDNEAEIEEIYSNVISSAKKLKRLIDIQYTLKRV